MLQLDKDPFIILTQVEDHLFLWYVTGG